MVTWLDDAAADVVGIWRARAFAYATIRAVWTAAPPLACWDEQDSPAYQTFSQTPSLKNGRMMSQALSVVERAARSSRARRLAYATRTPHLGSTRSIRDLSHAASTEVIQKREACFPQYADNGEVCHASRTAARRS